MRFRETLWFKKGFQQNSVEGQAADQAFDNSDEQVPEFELPIEDRYNDDGNVMPTDTAQFGVHTGTTQAITTLPRSADSDNVDERLLIREMKRRSWLGRR